MPKTKKTTPAPKPVDLGPVKLDLLNVMGLLPLSEPRSTWNKTDDSLYARVEAVHGEEVTAAGYSDLRGRLLEALGITAEEPDDIDG